MKLIPYLLGAFILFANITALATTHHPTQEMAAKAMAVKAPIVDRQNIRNNSAAVFMDIENHGKQAHRVIAAFSPAAQQTQLQKTKLAHDKPAGNQAITHITITPQNDKDLHFGGLHVMLVGLKEPLKQNMIIPIALIFEDGSWTDVYARVS